MVTAEKQRTEKVLEDAHLKLSSVISDIHGVSGRAMLEAIIAGERDPKVLAQLARGKDAGQDPRAGAGADEPEKPRVHRPALSAQCAQKCVTLTLRRMHAETVLQDVFALVRGGRCVVCKPPPQ